MTTPHPDAMLRPHTGRDAVAALLLLLAIYLLTMSGHLYSPDEEAMYYVTHGLAAGMGVALPEGDVVPMPAREGLDGHSYSPYGLLPSLLALPFYGLGALVARGADPAAYAYATRFAVSALNAPLTALTGSLLLLTVRRLGYGRRAGWMVALAYGLCTFAWPYARTFFSEPLAGLLLLLAIERALTFRTSGSGWAALLAGLAAGLLLTTRIAELIALPLLGLYLLAPRRQPGKPRTMAASVLFGLGLLPGVAILALYNLARFGTILATGYSEEGSAFTTPLLRGLYGLLLSPGKSLFLFAPPALLGLAGAVLLWRRWRAETLLLAALIVTHSILYALWHAWEGGGVWGPRLLLPIVPLLLLPAAPLFDTPPSQRRVVSWLAGGLLALGFVNALAGVLVNPSIYVNAGVPARYRLYRPFDSPLLAHWRILAERVRQRYTAGCAIGDGFFPREVRGAPLPRYTGSWASIPCRSDQALLLRLSINDARPAGVPPSDLALLVGGQRAGLRQGQGSQVLVMLPAGGGQVGLVSATWNPAQAGTSERNASIGTLVYRIEATKQNGVALPLADAAIEPPPASPRLRWGWYFVPYDRHLLDMWPWYLARSELAPSARRSMIATILGISALALCGMILALRGAGSLVAGVHHYRKSNT